MKLSHLIKAIYFTTFLLLFTTYIYSVETNETVQLKNNAEHNTNSQSFETLFKRANNLFSLEQYEEAIAFYKQAVALNPTCAAVFFNLGQALLHAEKYPEALYAYQKTIKLNPKHDRAFMQIGKVMIAVRQFSDAIKPLERSLGLNPTNTEARLMLVRVFNDKGQFDKSIRIIIEGLMLDPEHINLTFELGNTYNLANKIEESLAIYQDLDRRLPNNPSILYNIAFTYKKMGDMDTSLAYYNRTLEINPNHTEALFSRGLAYLVLGDFEKGWEGYEWRYSRPAQGSLRTYEKPRWDGSDLTGKTILLHAEQGLGDTFQFIRYAKLVKEKNGTVIVAVQKPLVTIIGRCKYIDQVISVHEVPEHFDCHAPLMSLPHILKTRLETIPSEHPYLFADRELITHWKKQLTADKNFKIGICWQGNDNYATPTLRTTVAQKSIRAEQFAPICQIPGVSVYSLQKTTGTQQLENLPANVKIITFDENFDQEHGRFMDTAALIKNLDLVITVDTSIGHIAAGLGAPTWIMLPNPADWRWMINRTDSPWYPTVQLFKQPQPGDWESMIQEVAQELKKYMASKQHE